MATSDDVARVGAETGMSLPASLLAFWSARDGVLTDPGIAVYSAKDIGERNTTYEIARHAPGFLLVGDDSGGTGFLVRADDPDSAVFSSGFGDLMPAHFDMAAEDFASWIDSLGLDPS